MPTEGDGRQLLTIDASAVISLLIDPSDAGERVAGAVRGADVIAPDLMPIEATNVLRRRRGADLLSVREAQSAFGTLRELSITLWPFETVATRVWELGDNLSAYDACYVALAEHTGSPLITRDARIARAPGVACEVVVLD